MVRKKKIVRNKKYKVEWDDWYSRAILYEKTKLGRWEKKEVWSIKFLMSSTLFLKLLEEEGKIFCSDLPK